MTISTLDELIVPAPPYRMARPMATLAIAPSPGEVTPEPHPDQTLPLAPKQELSVPTIVEQPEQMSLALALEEVERITAVRNRGLEAEHPTLANIGEQLSGLADLKEFKSDETLPPTPQTQAPAVQAPVVRPLTPMVKPEQLKSSHSKLSEEIRMAIRKQQKNIPIEHGVEEPTAGDIQAPKKEAALIEPRTPARGPDAVDNEVVQKQSAWQAQNEAVARASKDVLNAIARGEKVVDLSDGKAFAVSPSPEGGVRSRALGVPDVEIEPTPNAQDESAIDRAASEGMTGVSMPKVGSERIYQKAPAKSPDAIKTPEEKPLEKEIGSEYVHVRSGTPEGDAVAAVRAAAEKITSAQAENMKLREENARMKAALSAREQVRVKQELSPPAPEQIKKQKESEPESRPSAQAEIIGQLKSRIAQLESQIPNRETASARTVTPASEQTPQVHEIGEQQGLSFWEKFKAKRNAIEQDDMALMATAFAKKWQRRLAKRDEKIKKWEESAAKASKKGMIGVVKSWLWDESWADYHRWKGRNAYRKQEAWNDSRIRHENERNEILNLAGAKIDRLLDSQYERIDQYAFQRKELESQLTSFYTEHSDYSKELLAKETAESERIVVREILSGLEEKIMRTNAQLAEVDTRWQRERKRATKQKVRKEGLMSTAVRPSRVDTTPREYKWLTQRITQSGGLPKERSGTKRVRNLAA